MKSSKLLVLLQSFQAEEMRWMSKFVRSPYYNTNEKVIALYDYIRKYHPDFDSPKLEKGVIFKKILPGLPYNDQRLRLLMFRLSELVEEFLIVQRLKGDFHTREQILLEELEDRNLDRLVEKKNKDLLNKLEKEPFRDARYYQESWRLHHQRYFLANKERKKSKDHSLEDTLFHLDSFYFLTKLRYAGELFNRQNIFSESHEILLLDDIRSLLDQLPVFKQEHVFQIYQDILFLMENRLDEAIYTRLEKNVIQNLHLLRPVDQAALLRYLINSTIQLYQNGKMSYLNRQFNLYQLGLSKDLFYIEGQLPASTFLNIAITATVLKEIVWAENFIEQYHTQLPKEDQLDASLMAHAYCASAKGEMLLSNQHLNQMSRMGLGYMLRSKSLSLRNYYELFLQDASYYELFLYESKSFEKYIRRNQKISDNRAEGYLNFIAMLRKIGKLCSRELLIEKPKRQSLLDEISQAQVLVAKAWLLDKVRNL